MKTLVTAAALRGDGKEREGSRLGQMQTSAGRCPCSCEAPVFSRLAASQRRGKTTTGHHAMDWQDKARYPLGVQPGDGSAACVTRRLSQRRCPPRSGVSRWSVFTHLERHSEVKLCPVQAGHLPGDLSSEDCGAELTNRYKARGSGGAAGTGLLVER